MFRLLQKTLNILDDLALCSDDNDNDMTFVVRSGANDPTGATNKLYALQKSCNCLIQGTTGKHAREIWQEEE